MRLTRFAAPIVAAALLVTAIAGPAGATGRATADAGGRHLRAHVGGSSLHAAAAHPYDVVLDSISCYPSGGDGTIVGDVRNLTDLPVRGIEVTVRVEDAAGHVRGTAVGNPWFEFVDPGEYASFRIDVSNATGGTDCFADITDYTFTDIPANHYFTANSVNVTGWSDSVTRIDGMLANNNTVSASGVVLVATLYDANGKVVGTNTGSFSGSFTPGNTRAFQIDVEHTGSGVPDYYNIQAESGSDPQTATTMYADPTDFTYGGSTDVDGKGVPGNLVRVQRYDQPTANWMDVEGDDIKADNSGAYSLTLTPGGASSYRVISGSVTSVPIVLFVHAKVTMKASTKKVAPGKKVVLSGVAQPLDPGQRVSIQRKSGSSWKTIATVSASASGAFSYSWKPSTKGSYVLRAWVDGNTIVFSGSSSSVTVAVK